MAIWLPFAIQGGEALIVGIAAFLGAIPGIPAHDFQAAIAVAIAKALPGGILTKAITTTGGSNASESKAP